ncbi:YceD family protein [Thiomonas sp.]
MSQLPATNSADKGAMPPRALALFDFARSEGALQGGVPLTDLPRLLELLSSTQGAAVQWALKGFERERIGMRPQAMVTLEVRAELPLICQRCLQEMRHPVDEAVDFRLVTAEPELTQAEIEAEDEALPAVRPVDVLSLIEDQLILALPSVPMHDRCPSQGESVAAPTHTLNEPSAEPRQHPFANLRELIEGEKKNR